MQLDNLYRQIILDHYNAPRNHGLIDGDATAVTLNNPTCGDRVAVQLAIDGGVVKEARFTAQGCSICIASASMMTMAVKGKTVEQALRIAEDFSALVKGIPKSFDYTDIEAMANVHRFPARGKCATLAWVALTQGLTPRKPVDHSPA